MRAQLATGVVHGLVERAAGRSETFCENINRHIVKRHRHEDVALAPRQPGSDPLAENEQQLSRFDLGLWRLPGGNEGLPCAVGERKLASLPSPPPQRYGRRKDGELVDPGREAAVAPKFVEPPKQRHHRVIGALHRQIVEVVAAEMREPGPLALQLDPRSADEQLVQPSNRELTFLSARRERFDPLARLVVQSTAGAGIDRLDVNKGGHRYATRARGASCPATNGARCASDGTTTSGTGEDR